MGILKRIVESVFGYKIEKSPVVGIDPFKDLSNLIRKSNSLCVFDVGANEGQSVIQIKKHFMTTKIHCFEPNELALNSLKSTYANDESISINFFALGAKPGVQDFYENELSDMSSFLELGEKGWGKTNVKKPVRMTTMDQYCLENGVGYIDILKLDTQGFELEVLKGAAELLINNKINFVLMEVTFADIYKGLPSFDVLYKLMMDSGFRLVTFYEQHYYDRLISWTDVLFVNAKFEKK